MSALIVFSLEDWDGVWRRNQYVIDGMLRADPGLRVLFVEPARDPVHDLRRRHRPTRGAGWRVADGYEGRLHLFQPTKALPRLAGPAADALLWRAVRGALRRSSVAAGVLWVNDPAWAQAVARLDWPSLYDMTDDWLSADRGEREHQRLVADEETLMQRSERIVVCSPGLLASRRDRRPDAVLVPNAVDVARYREPAPRPADLPDGRAAVYVGTLHEDRLDVDLVVATGAQLAARGAHLVLVGPNALGPQSVAALDGAAGVVVLGARAYDRVPAYLQHADTLVVPHVVDAFTDSLDPIKAYEYLAVGRPIVSTPVAGFRELADLPGVEVVARERFAAAVSDRVVDGADAGRIHTVPDWSERVAAFSSIVADLMPERARR